MTKYDCSWHQVDDPSPRECQLITVSNRILNTRRDLSFVSKIGFSLSLHFPILHIHEGYFQLLSLHIYHIYVCVYVYMRLLKKYCHRLRSLCDGKMCAEGENMSESSRINRLHWQYLLCRSGEWFPVTLKDFSENTPQHSRFALSSRSTLIVDRKPVISSPNIL